MATVTIAPQAAGVSLPEAVKWFTWTPLTTTNDVGSWLYVGPYTDISVHVYGTFGAGGTLKIEGSNEIGAPSNQVVLTDQSDNLLSFTVAGMESVMQSPVQIRPHVTAGDGATSLTVAIKLTTGARR